MALNDKIKVELPQHCVKVPKNGTTYIQYTLRAYRNAKGKPTSDRIVIGKLDEATGMLIPNRNYYEIFEKKDPEYTPEFVRSNGVYALISEIAKGIGLKKALEQAFPESCNEILSVAQYMLTEGKGELFFEDARTIIPEELPDIDLICGVIPYFGYAEMCQSFSIAGKRGGFEDARGTFFFEIVRIARVKATPHNSRLSGCCSLVH